MSLIKPYLWWGSKEKIMYAKRIQIKNYGPIEDIDITFPFDGENPKPILLVGENGSGKSIFLSHIVNCLMLAQSEVYPNNSEVKKGNVYKLLSPSYIKSKNIFSWWRVEFGKELFWEEMVLSKLKKNFREKPNIVSAEIWNQMKDTGAFGFHTNINSNQQIIDTVKNLFQTNSVLYFPPNRFEEPAWLNEKNLLAKVEYMEMTKITGYTNRKIINYSPLRDNQNWLFEVLYDRAVFEIQRRQASEKPNSFTNPWVYRGMATQIANLVLHIVRQIFQADKTLRFGIGERHNRRISLMQNDRPIVPNIFQLSSGETALLNLFLSILRDCDLSDKSLADTNSIQGIVIVDEIDLHLHSTHQHEILPTLIKMFPRVQFIVTTHSPLFVLGMEKTFGKDGFALYSLPRGNQIDPEQFGEFGSAYNSFRETERFLEDTQDAIKKSKKPVLFMEGATDIKYLQKAAELFDETELFNKFEIKDGDDHRETRGGGSGKLDKIWKHFDSKLAYITPQKIVLLYDCDVGIRYSSKGNIFKRNIPQQENHPIKAGIENLFSQATLSKAIEHKIEFIDIESQHEGMVRGQTAEIPEKWTVNTDEKRNLCDWLCEHGTQEYFQYFEAIFDLLESVLDDGGTDSQQPPQGSD